MPDRVHVFGIKVWLHEVCTLSYDNSLLSWIWRREIGFDNIHFILIRKEKTLASGLSVTLCVVLTSVNNMFFHSAPMSAALCGTNHPLSIGEWGWPAMNQAFNSLCIWFKLKPLISQTHLQLLHGETFYDERGKYGQIGKINERKPHAGYIKCEYNIRTPAVLLHSQRTFRGKKIPKSSSLFNYYSVLTMVGNAPGVRINFENWIKSHFPFAPPEKRPHVTRNRSKLCAVFKLL